MWQKGGIARKVAFEEAVLNEPTANEEGEGGRLGRAPHAGRKRSSSWERRQPAQLVPWHAEPRPRFPPRRHASAERIAETRRVRVGEAASPRRHTSSDAMAKAKPRAAGSSSSGAKPAWPRVLTQAKRPTLIVVTLFVMFKWILPYLADLTPPGVDVQLIQAEAVKRAARAKDKCATVCDGMNCPAGWQTGRSPEDHCKCICVRTDPSKATAWDRAHNQARFFPEDETAGATHVKSHEPDS